MKTPQQIAAGYTGTARAKVGLSASSMVVAGILAGAFIGLGALGSQIASLSVPAAARLVSALIFPIGLLMVLCAGAELFTGNCLLFMELLDHTVTPKEVLRSWGLVYLGNALGGFLVALLAFLGHSYALFDGALSELAVSTALSKVSLSFGDAFFRGILCNVLVCLAVWISFGAEELAGKILGLYPPTALFVLCGFEHCVANFYFIPAGMLLAGGAEPRLSVAALLHNILPVTLGNLVGGALLVGGGYWLLYRRGRKGT